MPEGVAESCPYCGQALPSDTSVESQPMFEIGSPGCYFFCPYCGLPLFGSAFGAAPLDE